MATFEAQVEALTGLAIDDSSAPTQTELTQFLTDGAKEILNSLSRSRQEMFTTTNKLNASNTSLTLLGSEVFSVTRDDETIHQPCRKVPANLKGRIEDSDDMMAATSTDPAYYIYNTTLYVIPTPSSSQKAFVQTLVYPIVAFGDSAVGNTSLSGVTATAADPTVFTKSSHGLSTGDIVKLSNFTEMTEINEMTGTVTRLDSSTFEINGVSADPAETTGGDVTELGRFPNDGEYLIPLYASIKSLQNKMSSKFAELPTDVTFISLPVAPVAPILISNQIGTLPTAPVYTGLSIAPSFSTVDTFISTDEDVELASVKIQEINSQINEYQASMQNQINLFNDANVEYQAEVNKLTENARLSSQDDVQSLQKYSNELGSYGTRVQIYQADASTKIQNYSAKIQKHVTDYQWLSGQYKQLKDDYTAGLQKLVS
tara:strand:- start:2352 stop:3638 length:1287 start_codon:yes stop_codon:yes gene_type:complete